MRISILTICALLLAAIFTGANAQTEEQTNEENKLREEIIEEITELRLKKEDIEIEEKQALKDEVAVINERLDKGEISAARATELKEAAAEKRAKNIENRTAIIDNQIALLERNGKLGFVESEEKPSRYSLSIGGEGEPFIKYEDREKKVKYDERTFSTLLVAAGFNNALYDGQSISDSDYKLAGSRFFEFGVTWNTRILKNSNFMRIRYGFAFQFNGLKPTDNRIYEENSEGQMVLEEFSEELDKSKFRMDHLVFPVHLEFGPSKKVEKEESIRFTTKDVFKIGLGGYAGFNLDNVQKLKYDIGNKDIKEKIEDDFHTSDFIYGLSAYVGWGETSLYVKYDLNPIFENAIVDQNNFSVGVRFDIK